MKTFRFALCIILIIFSLCGCGKNVNMPDIDSIDISTISFSIPEPYSIIGIDSKSSSISDGEQTIGGIILTDIVAESLDDLEKDSYFQYVINLGENIAFFATYFDSYISITTKDTNTETTAVFNEIHYLFMKDGYCFDLWLNTDIVDEETRTLIRDSIIE